MFHTSIQTPIGKTFLAKSESGVYRITINNEAKFQKGLAPNAIENPDAFLQESIELTEYFEGKRTQFTFPLDMQGTEFQQKVWRTLLEIPFGLTWSYGQLAKYIQAPEAAQAVGAANGQNPIWLVVPCHRVVGANGDLTGYAGGIETKRWLLQHEGALLL